MTRTVRDGDVADVERLLALENEIFGAEAWSQTSLMDELMVTGRVLVSAGVDGVDGYAVISVAGESADLRRLAVAPRCRGGSVGRLLLTRALDRATAQGCTEMFLEAAASNGPAIRLYESAGFEAVGVRPRYYPDGADAVVYRRALPVGAG